MYNESEDFVRMGQKASRPAMDPSVHDLTTEEEIEARLRRIRAIPNDSERFYQVSILRGQIETLKRNQANGYAGWETELHILEEVVKRSDVGIYGGMW